MAKVVKDKSLYNSLKVLGCILLLVIVVCLVYKMLGINLKEGFKGKKREGMKKQKESMKELLTAAENMIENMD